MINKYRLNQFNIHHGCFWEQSIDDFLKYIEPVLSKNVVFSLGLRNDLGIVIFDSQAQFTSQYSFTQNSYENWKID